MNRLIDADRLKLVLDKNFGDIGGASVLMQMIDQQSTVLEEGYELRLLKNYLSEMPKVYGKRTMNWCVVRDLLMSGTSTGGKTSCIGKCRELGIDPWGYNLKGAVKDE